MMLHFTISHRLAIKLKVLLSYGIALNNFYPTVGMMNSNQLKITLPSQSTHLYSNPMNTTKAFWK